MFFFCTLWICHSFCTYIRINSLLSYIIRYTLLSIIPPSYLFFIFNTSILIELDCCVCVDSSLSFYPRIKGHSAGIFKKPYSAKVTLLSVVYGPYLAIFPLATHYFCLGKSPGFFQSVSAY